MFLCVSCYFLLRGKGLESLKDTIRSRVDADRGDVTPANHAVGIDDEQGAVGNAVVLAVRAVGPRDGPLGLEVRQ